MKTAISLPDPIFKEAERFAKRSKKSRSSLYTEAIKEYLERHAPDDVTEAMNKVCDQIETRADRFIAKSSRMILSSESW